MGTALQLTNDATPAPASRPMSRSAIVPPAEREAERERGRMLMAEIAALRERKGLTLKDLARLAGYDRSLVGKWARGNRAALGHRGLNDALAAVVQQHVEGETSPHVAPTRTLDQVLEACTVSRLDREMVVVVGPPRTGKTFGLEEYERRERAAGRLPVFVTASTLMTPAQLVGELCAAAGVRANTPAAQLRELARHLEQTERQVLVDECNHLDRQSLDALRYLHDKADVGVVLGGSMELERTLANPALQQLHGRIGLKEIVSPMNAAETTVMARARLGERCTQSGLDAIYEKTGGLPGLVARLLKRCERVMELSRVDTCDHRVVAKAATRIITAQQ